MVINVPFLLRTQRRETFNIITVSEHACFHQSKKTNVGSKPQAPSLLIRLGLEGYLRVEKLQNGTLSDHLDLRGAKVIHRGTTINVAGSIAASKGSCLITSP